MAKKQARLRKRRSAVRGKSRRTSRFAGRKAAKRSAAKSMPKKRLAKAKPSRARAKKVLRKNMRTPQSEGIPVRETAIVDVIEEPVPGVITITEFEETHVRKGSVDRAQPEED
jgi:hypothetical protein